MFKLNFKENIKDLVKDQVDQLLDTVVDTKVKEIVTKKEEESVENKNLLQTDKYLELIELINLTAKNSIKAEPQDKVNLFSAKSVITVAAFLITSVLVQLDNALIDKKISYNEGIGLSIALLGAISTIAARGAEGKEGVYTPKYLPGLNKEDYNNDGVINELDITK